MLDTLLKNWRTTLLGIIAILTALIPPLRDWITSTTHIDFGAILALVVGLMGALSKDAHTA